MNAKYVLHAENTCNIFNVHVIISLEVDLLPWTQHRPEKHGYSDLLVEITCTALLVHMIGLTNDVPWPQVPKWTVYFCVGAVRDLIFSHAVCLGANIEKKTVLGKLARPNSGKFVPKWFLRAKLWSTDFIITVSLE